MPEATKRSQMDDRRPNYRDLQDNLRDLGKQLEAAESLNTRYREELRGALDSLGQANLRFGRLTGALVLCRDTMNAIWGTVDQPNDPTAKQVIAAQDLAREALAPDAGTETTDG